MTSQKRHAHIAYRCPECNTVIYGLAGEFALTSSMMRLNCSCGKSALTISPTHDGKIKLSVPVAKIYAEKRFRRPGSSTDRTAVS